MAGLAAAAAAPEGPFDVEVKPLDGVASLPPPEGHGQFAWQASQDELDVHRHLLGDGHE